MMNVNIIENEMKDFSQMTEKEKTVILTNNIDVDINMEILKEQGITESSIDKLFDEDLSKKRTQSELDDIMIRDYVSNPTREKFNKLWERYYFGIKTYAHKFMHDWDQADDIALQTFARAWEQKEKYDINKAKYSTWLYIICKNMCLGEINLKKKQNIINNDISNMYDATLIKNHTQNKETTQYIMENNNLVANSKDDIIMKTYDASLNEIDKLGKMYSKIMRMKFVEDLKIREIAEQLNMNESTVKNYLYKGKEIINNVMKTKHKHLYDMYVESNVR